MFISGTLRTVIGDFCSHNTGLDRAGAQPWGRAWRWPAVDSRPVMAAA
jgi:hypothetical protein